MMAYHAEKSCELGNCLAFGLQSMQYVWIEQNFKKKRSLPKTDNIMKVLSKLASKKPVFRENVFNFANFITEH